MKIKIDDCLDRYIGLILILFLCCFSCKQSEGHKSYDLKKVLPSLTKDSLYGMVLTPAGEISQYIWEDSRVSFIDTNYFALWNYLPWPVNEGILLQKNQSYKVRIPAMIIHERIPFGQVLPVRVLGSLSYTIDQQDFSFILLIPTSSAKSPIKINSFHDLNTKFDPVKYQIQQWITHHQGTGKVQRIQWQNEQYAQILISQREAN